MRRKPAIRTEELAAWRMDDRDVPCLLRRSSARRTLAMRVDEVGRLVVNAPLRAPASAIWQFVGLHTEWLRGQLTLRAQSEIQWWAGMRLPFMGVDLELLEAPGGAAVERVDSRLLVARIDSAATAVPGWYRSQARQVLDSRIKAICRGLGRIDPPWRLSNAQTRWGSLSSKGVVGLNWRLVKAGLTEIDYVICHELAHFRQRNHSPAFWREVEILCPGYEAARRSLRANSRHYFQF